MMLSAGSISSTQGDLLLSDARFDVIPVQPPRQPGVQWTVLRPLLDPSGLLLSLSPDAQYSVAGGSSTTAPTLTVSAGLVALTDDLSRTFGSGGGAPVVVTGGRLVLLGSQVFKSLSIDNGAVSLAGGPAAQLTLVGPLSITATGTLDLGSAGLLLPTSANANIGAYLAQAAGPALPDGEHTWTGTGLTSSVVEADAANGNPKALALGYFDSRDDAQTGLSVRTGQTLVKVTVYGDATGDGINDTADFTIWRNNFFKGNRWSQGDFNYDGVIDTADFTIWRNNFFKHASGPTAGGATAAAPLAVSVGGSAAAAAGTSASAISSQAVAVAAASPAQAAPHARHSTAVCNGGAGRIPSVAHASSPLPRAPFSVTPIGDSAEAAPSAPASAAAFGGGAVSDASRGAAFEAHRRRVRGVL
jgi:hypothetical protein